MKVLLTVKVQNLPTECRSWPLPCCCWPCHHLSVFFHVGSVLACPSCPCPTVATALYFPRCTQFVGSQQHTSVSPTRNILHQESSFTPEAEGFYTSHTLQNAIGNIHGNPEHSSTNKDENDAWRQRHPGMQKKPMENALSIWGSSSARPMTPWSDQELVIPCRFWTTEHSFWSPAISQECVSCETSFKHGSGIVQKYCPCHETWHSSETKRLPRKVILFLFFSVYNTCNFILWPFYFPLTCSCFSSFPKLMILKPLQLRSVQGNVGTETPAGRSFTCMATVAFSLAHKRGFVWFVECFDSFSNFWNWSLDQEWGWVECAMRPSMRHLDDTYGMTTSRVT